MARELPIHNGRMTTDLDANGFKIKNLHPGSGFTQAQSDWNQADATAPDFIKNKPPIPAGVTVDSTLTEQGAAADAKVVGDALRSGFTEWVCVPTTYNGKTLHVEWENEEWNLYADDQFLDPPTVAPGDATNLTFSVYGVTATRLLITPMKTSQLTNDGDGSAPNVGYVLSTDTRLSDERAPTAHAHVIADVTGLGAALLQKANITDLTYRLVEPGKWEFSGLPSGATDVAMSWNSSRFAWVLEFEVGGISNTIEGMSPSGENALSVHLENEAHTIIATRASLPGHLLDRAVNAVSVTGATTLTLPALVNAGKARDFLVKVTTSSDDLNITWQGQGSEAPNGADELQFVTEDGDFPVVGTAGDYLFSFTEVEAHTFAVSMKPLVAAPQAQGGS